MNKLLRTLDAMSVSATVKYVTLFIVCFVGYFIIQLYRRYFPPIFAYGFLQGREDYFLPFYAVAFYTHIISAPVALFTGAIQFVDRLRISKPKLHRWIGMIYVATVLGLVAPSGLAMAFAAPFGWITIVGFALLSVLTWLVTLQAFRLAKQHRFRLHEQWMIRSYVLICSAVALRLLAIVETDLHLDPIWSYRANAWLSWVIPLAIYEGWRRKGVK
jgi:uncharacterized membrane protein